MTKQKSVLYGVTFQCKDDTKTNSFYESVGIDLALAEINVLTTGAGSFPVSDSTILMVECEDVEAMAKSLSDAGATIIKPPSFGLMGTSMIVADPDGRPVIFTEGMDKVKSRLSEMCGVPSS